MLTQELESDTFMSVVVEPVIHLDTLESAVRVVGGQLVEDVDLQLGRVPILLHVLNNLDGQGFLLVQVLALDHLAKSALPQLIQYFIPKYLTVEG